MNKVSIAAIAAASISIAACGANNRIMLPGMGSDMVAYAAMPKDTIGEELPSEGLGAIKSVKWDALLGGYTQQARSQSLGFPPNTTITIQNLSKTTTHTLDVVKVIAKPPAGFPRNIKLSVDAKGGDKLEVGYASGPIKPGKSVTVTLAKAGIYLIGCAYHYNTGGMHTVLIVARSAAPGPQATPPQKGSGSGSGSGSGW
jgi:plastocyanin